LVHIKVVGFAVRDFLQTYFLFDLCSARLSKRNLSYRFIYEFVSFRFAGIASKVCPSNNDLGTHYKMATEVNQNYFAWSQEESSAQGIPQVALLSPFVLLACTISSLRIYLI
jgi:hypothetical protein